MSTYSTNLELELPSTGSQAGQWGVTANRDMGTLIEQAIAGYVTQDFDTDSDITLTIASGSDAGGNTTPGVIYSSGTAADPISGRNMYIVCTGTITAAKNLIVPSNKKLYFVYNNTTGGFGITVKVSSGTGVTVPYGKKMALVCDGSDIYEAVTYFANFSTVAINATPIGNTSPSTGAFTDLAASGVVSGSGFETYLASPPEIGGSSPGIGTFTTLTATTITGDFSGSVAGAVAATTLSASGAVSGTGFTDYFASPPAIGGTAAASGKFTKAYTASVNLGTITTSLAPDCSTSNVFYCTATSATAFTCAPTNPSDGQTINIFITQPSSGSNATWTATWAKWPGGSTNGALSTSLSAIDIVVATYRNSTWYATIAKAFA